MPKITIECDLDTKKCTILESGEVSCKESITRALKADPQAYGEWFGSQLTETVSEKLGRKFSEIDMERRFGEVLRGTSGHYGTTYDKLQRETLKTLKVLEQYGISISPDDSNKMVNEVMCDSAKAFIKEFNY